MAALKTVLLILVCSIALPAYAANLYLSPASGTFDAGKSVTIHVMVSSSEPINAISGTLSVPTSLFSIEQASKSGSILNFWVTEPKISNGTMTFEGVALGGFSGGTGKVASVTLRAKSVGSGALSLSGVQILANDGKGTNVTKSSSGGTYSVQEAPAPVVKSEPEPEVEPEEPQPAPTLSSPEIMLARQFGEKVISGTSEYPHAEVLLTFVSSEGVKVFITNTTDAEGNFIALVPGTLKRGEYTVRAVVILSEGENSFESNEISIYIGDIISDISLEIRLILLLLALLMIALMVRAVFAVHKNKFLRRVVKKEAEGARETMHKTFDLLEEDLEGSTVAHMKGKEKEVINDLKKDLKDAEKLLDKEIKDIDKL